MAKKAETPKTKIDRRKRTKDDRKRGRKQSARDESTATKKTGSIATKAATESAQYEREQMRRLAQTAIRKRQIGETPSRAELAAWKKWESLREEELRWKYYRTIPQKHWREMSGRQARVINEQAQRYGIPFGGASVDLPAAVRALHDFLARNKVKLARDDSDDPLLGGENSPALERYRDERAKLARLDRLEREKTLLPRDQVHELLGQIAALLRGAGENLQRQFGSDAHAVLDEALDDADREIERFFESKTSK